LPVARAIDRAVNDRTDGPVLRHRLGRRMDRHAATRRARTSTDTTATSLPPTWPPRPDLPRCMRGTRLGAAAPARD